MPKAIKFNLILDGNPVRNIEGVKKNFNIEDLLSHYKSGLLFRWLKVRQYDIAHKIKEIDSDNDVEIAKLIISAFEMSSDEHEINSAVYPFIFRKEKEKQLEQYNKNLFKEKEIIEKYHKNYTVFCEQLRKNKADYAFIKSGLSEMYEKYYSLFKLDFENFSFQLEQDAPLILFGILSNENLRDIFLDHDELKGSFKLFLKNYLVKSMILKLQQTSHSESDNKKNTFSDIIKKQIEEYLFIYKNKGSLKEKNINLYNFSADKHKTIDLKGSSGIVIIDSNITNLAGEDIIGRLIPKAYHLIGEIERYGYINVTYTTIDEIKKAIERDKQFSSLEIIDTRQDYLSLYLKTYNGHTESYWKDIEPKGKKYLIVSMEQDNFVRNAGQHGEELTADEVNDNFPILDGIDYKSNNTEHSLVYMEV